MRISCFSKIFLLSILLFLIGCDGSNNDDSQASIPPIPQAVVEPDSGLIPLYVNYSAIGSEDPDGEIIRYSWDFDGDLRYDWTSTTSGDVTYKFMETGTFYSILNVIDDTNIAEKIQIQIKVTSLFPNLIQTHITTDTLVSNENLEVFAITDLINNEINFNRFSHPNPHSMLGTVGSYGRTDQDGDIFLQATVRNDSIPAGRDYMVMTGFSPSDQRVQCVYYNWLNRSIRFLNNITNRQYTLITTTQNQTVTLDTITLTPAIRLLNGAGGEDWQENQLLRLSDFPRHFHWQSPDTTGRFRYAMLILDETTGEIADSYPEDHRLAPEGQTYYEYPFPQSGNQLIAGHTYRWLIIGGNQIQRYYNTSFTEVGITSELYGGRFQIVP